MGLHTRKQFAELLGLDYEDKNVRATITMWKKRGNILLNADDLIDDTNTQNSFWIQKQINKTPKIVSDVKVVESDLPTNSDIESSSLIKKPKAKDSTTSNAVKERFELDTEKRIKEIEKLEVDIRLQELKEEKIRGEVIPIVLSTQLFMTHNQSIVTAQKDGIERLLINIAKECRLTGEQLAKLRGKMVEILNDAVDNSIIITGKKIKSLIDEFSIKKEVGEKD